MEITCKRGNGGHADDDFVGFAILPGSDNAFHDRGSNFVADGVLSVGGGGYEELVFDVDEMLTIMDYLDVCVGNGVLALSVEVFEIG